MFTEPVPFPHISSKVLTPASIKVPLSLRTLKFPVLTEQPDASATVNSYVPADKL